MGGGSVNCFTGGRALPFAAIGETRLQMPTELGFNRVSKSPALRVEKENWTLHCPVWVLYKYLSYAVHVLAWLWS